MTLYLQRMFPVSVLCTFFLLSQKAHAFDYDKYSKTHRQLRALTSDSTNAAVAKSDKKSRAHAFEMFAQKLLEAMQGDAVPAKFFDTGTNLSFYFKPAKVTKIGIKYKF